MAAFEVITYGRFWVIAKGLRDRIWWGAASDATAAWAGKLGMNLQTSTLKFDETGEPLHIQQAAQIRAFRAVWKEAGHTRTPRVSVSRSIFALISDEDRTYLGQAAQEQDTIGFLDETTRAVFGRSYAAEPDVLIEQLRKDESRAQSGSYFPDAPTFSTATKYVDTWDAPIRNVMSRLYGLQMTLTVNARYFEIMLEDLRFLPREFAGRKSRPMAMILNGRTLQSTPESGARAGYDGAKRHKGSKVHAAVDTLGHLLAVHATVSDEQDRAQVEKLAEAVQEITGKHVELAYVDQPEVMIENGKESIPW